MFQIFAFDSTKSCIKFRISSVLLPIEYFEKSRYFCSRHKDQKGSSAVEHLFLDNVPSSYEATTLLCAVDIKV